jgi:ribonuclease E
VGGIVVIDFIDMVLESNRELVLRRLLECLARDRTKHQVAEVTSLGLVQMTRKRVGAGLLEAFSTPCECCNGRGVILNFEPDGDGQSSHHVHARNGGNGGRNVAAVAPRPEQADADKPDAPPRQDNGRQDNGRQENGQAEPPRPPSRRRRRKAPATATATAGTPAPAEPEAPQAHDGAA